MTDTGFLRNTRRADALRANLQKAIADCVKPNTKQEAITRDCGAINAELKAIREAYGNAAAELETIEQ